MTRKYKILFISTSYPTNNDDWRGVFISQLAHALSAEQEYVLKLWTPPGEFPEEAEYVCTQKEREWLSMLMKQGGIANLLRQGGARSVLAAFLLLKYLADAYKREKENVDLVHVNWLQNILPLGKSDKPLLVTVLGTDLKLLRLPGMKFLLRKVLKNRRCIVAPNAEWMVPVLRTALSDVCEIRHINFGIESYWYQLRRNKLSDTKKWLVVLRLTKKKIGSLFEWGEDVFKNVNHELHLFGPMQEQLEVPEWINYHGATNPQELYNVWFPQAAGLITLSEHDEGRPQVILEAMAAGLPVIASAIPAHSNILEHQKTGWLCTDRNDFAQAIAALSNQDGNEKLGLQAQSWMKENIGTWRDCAKRYITAYQDLLGNKL